MKRTMRTAHEKSKMALEAIRGLKTVNELASEYGIHPSQLHKWKSHLEQCAYELFERENRRAAQRQKEALEREEHFLKTIGELTVEVAYLKKKSGLGA